MANVTKLYNKFVYYKQRAEKRPYACFTNKLKPSTFMSNYLIYKERAAWLLTSGQAFTALELAQLHEMAERPQTLNCEPINESIVKVQFFNIREVIYA